jgi:ankyrin repeat protein
MGDLNWSLIDAAKVGDTQRCAGLIEQGADVNTFNRLRVSPLWAAANNDHIETCRLLVEKGADVNFSGSAGMTPAMCAAKRHGPRLLDFMIEKGADSNSCDDYGWTLLIYAARHEHYTSCKAIVERGAVLNAAGKDGLTPFQCSVSAGLVNAVRYFIDVHGEDPAQRAAGGKTMLQLASKHPEVKELLKVAKTEKAVKDGIGAHYASGVVPSRSGISPI